MIGHNAPSFDVIVEENLLRGLFLSQLNCITRAIKDPRLSARHYQVLAHIIEHTNGKTGMAYPGRARLATEVTYYVSGEPKRYSEATIATTIAELVECGYIVTSKRAPEGGKRALSHYTTTMPDIDDLQRQIAIWCEFVKARPKREFPTSRTADVDTRINVSRKGKSTENGSDVDDRLNVGAADVDTGLNVDTRIDVNTGIGQELVESNIPLDADEPPRRKARTKLPEDWAPAAPTIAWAKTNFVVTDQQVADEAEKFHAYHFGKGSKMADWPAAWRTWWFNGYHKHPRRRKGAMGTDPKLPFGKGSHADASKFNAALDRVLAEEEAERCQR